MILPHDLSELSLDPTLVGQEALRRNLEALCQFACAMITVAHSGFVWFRTMEFGEVVAQFPNEGFEGLLGRRVQLSGIEAEERLINEEDAIEIPDVDDPWARKELGLVADLLDEFNIKSLYIVKVRIRGEAIGSFSLDRTGTARDFTDDEKSLCKELARLASSTIESALLSDWLEIFQEATKAIISQQEIGTLLNTIVGQALHLLSVEEAGIYERLYDEAGEFLQLSACSPRESTRVIRRDDKGMAWQLIDGKDGGQGYLETTDYSEYKEAARQFKETGRFGSVLEVPMTWLDERIGVLFVAGVKGRKFSKFSADRLQRIADIATLAIQRCRLLNRIENISNANVDFAKGLESDSLKSQLTLIARYATEILGAEMCGIFRIRDLEKMTLEAGFGHQPDGFPIGDPFPIIDEDKSGLTGAIAHRLREEHKKFISEGGTGQFKGLRNIKGQKLTTDQAVKGKHDNSPSGKCYSLLAIPLLSIPPDRAAMTGLLRISNKKGVGGVPSASIQFTQEDEWILRIFAEAAALAIEKAEIFTERKAQLDLYQTFSEVLTDEADLDSRLDSIAKQMAVVLKKSYCRILFSEDSSVDEWKVRAAGFHPRNSAEPIWNPGKGGTVKIRDGGYLRKMLEESAPQVMIAPNSNSSGSIADLSDSLQIGELKSVIAVPLTLKTEVTAAATAVAGVKPHIVGALEFGELRDSERGRGIFSAQEIEDVSHPALLTAELLKRDTIRERERELDLAFHEALARIREAEPVENLLMQIKKEARTLFNYDVAVILVQRSRDSRFEIIGDHEFNDRLTEDEQTSALFEKAFADETTIEGVAMRQLCERIGLQPTAMLVTRLYDGTECRYGLVLTQTRPPVFESEVQKRVLLNLSRQCTISLNRAVIKERLELMRKAIDLFGQTMADGKPEEALTNALEGIKDALACDSVILYEIDSRSREFLGPHSVGDVNPANIAPPGRALDDTAVGRILRKGCLHVASDAASDEIMRDAFQEQEEIESSAGMPISVNMVPAGEQGSPEQKVDVGVLFVNYKQPRQISRDDQRIFESFAPYVALAVRNQERYEQERKKRKIQDALLAAAKSFSESLEPAQIEDQIAVEASKIARAAGREINFVVVKLMSGNATRIVSAFPSEEMTSLRHELRSGKAEIPLTNEGGQPYGVVGRAFKNKRTEIVNEVLTDPDYIKVHKDTKSQMVVLLPPRENPLGMISIESPNQNTFYEEDAETFELFAALAADAIRNAQQYDALTEVTAMAVADIWASIFTHDYSSATEDIIRAATLLLENIEKSTHADQLTEPVNVVVKRGQRLRELIPRRIAYESFPTIKLDDELARWSADRKPSLIESGIELVYLPVASDVRVRIHPRLLDYVLDGLLKNAVPLLRAAETKEITLKAINGAQGVQIVLSNTGPAIPKTLWKHLGVRRVESTTGGQGWGLLIACEIIKFCKGQFLKLTNEHGEVTLGMLLPEVQDSVANEC